jgi:hypothetical protein
MHDYIWELETWIVTVIENELTKNDIIDSKILFRKLIKKFYIEGFKNLRNGLDAILAKDNFCKVDTIIFPIRLYRAVNTIITPSKDAHIYSACVAYAFEKQVRVFLITNDYKHLLANSQGLFQQCPFVRISRPLYAISRYNSLKNQKLPNPDDCDWHTFL